MTLRNVLDITSYCPRLKSNLTRLFTHPPFIDLNSLIYLENSLNRNFPSSFSSSTDLCTPVPSKKQRQNFTPSGPIHIFGCPFSSTLLFGKLSRGRKVGVLSYLRLYSSKVSSFCQRYTAERFCTAFYKRLDMEVNFSRLKVMSDYNRSKDKDFLLIPLKDNKHVNGQLLPDSGPRSPSERSSKETY